MTPHNRNTVINGDDVSDTDRPVPSLTEEQMEAQTAQVLRELHRLAEQLREESAEMLREHRLAQAKEKKP